MNGWFFRKRGDGFRQNDVLDRNRLFGIRSVKDKDALWNYFEPDGRMPK